MKFKVLSIAALFAFLFIGTSCEDDDNDNPTPVETHTITGFTTIGQVGGTIEIEGTEFLTDKSQITVTFLGAATNTEDDKTVAADDFMSATATELQLKVPAGAATGKISVEQNGKTVSTTTDFMVSDAVTITDFTDGSMAAKTGTMTIEGTNFLTTAEDITVTFLGADGDDDNAVVATEDITATATALNVKVPADAVSGKVKVEQAGFLAVESNNDITLVDAHTITEPTTEATKEQSFTIEGTNFATDAQYVTVQFTTDNGMTEATVTEATATSLKVTVPADAVTGRITVTQYDLTVETTGDVTVN